MELKPEDLSLRERYGFLIGSVLPRPIAWVSTMDESGVFNLAPFSYFTAVCSNPMTLLFCPAVGARSGGKKDTLRNIEALGEFVINLTNFETAQAMNLSATELPPGVSEFEWAGVTPVPSVVVRPPRVAEAPFAFECVLRQIVRVSDVPGGGSAVFGEVRHLHVRDDVYRNGRIDLASYRPIGRLGGDGYCRVTDTFEMARVPAPDAGQTAG